MAKGPSLFCIGCMLSIAGCAEESLSVGELRCESTHCEPPSLTRMAAYGPELEAIDAGEARVVWTAEPPRCGDDGCHFVSLFGADHAQWVVHDDGSVTTARTFTYQPEDEPRIVRSGVSLARFAAGGEVLSENHDVAHDDSMDSGRIMGSPSIALAADGGDAALLAVGDLSDDAPAPIVYAVPASGEPERMFALPAGGAPAALATSGNDLLIAGLYGRNVELARHDRAGELQWRQTALLPRSDFLQPAAGVSGVQLAVDGAGRSALLVPGGPAYGLTEVAPSGEVSTFMWIANPDRQTVKAQVAYDGEDRMVAAFDAYEVLRCRADSCDFDGTEPVLARREREEYYDADVLGMDVDADDRIYVLTHEGVRSQHRLLLDRISADFTQRETFLVADGEQLVHPDSDAFTLPHEIRIGPQGDIYVWTPERIGLIELP